MAGLSASWLDGAVYVEYGGAGLLLDAPPGIVDRLGDRLPNLQSVLLTSGRIGAVGGLVPLLVALERWRVRDVPLSLRFLLGEERGATLAETWVRCWPDAYPLTLDAEVPGTTFDVGALTVSTVALRAAEPRWRLGRAEPVVAVAVRVVAPGASLAWVPGAAPDRAVKRACAGVDLAVIEVGAVPWPPTAGRWRMSVADALEAGGDAGALWVVGDDGRLGPGEDH